MFRGAFAASALILSGLLAVGCATKVRTFGSGGSGGGTTSSSSGTGGGEPIKCTVATDCPGKETQCAQRTCDNGLCGQKFTAKGTAIDAQAVGDCHQAVCDGSGSIELQVDDSDTPNDNNPCTKDLCVNGTPSNPPELAGGDCGMGLKCDGNGHCTGCTGPEMCPGVDDECKQRSCTNGTCDFIFTQSGTAVANQTAGDCKKNVCNGMGNVSVVFDANDAPNSGIECVIDGCAMGTPTKTNKAAGATCTMGGNYCDGSGNCVECVNPTTCPGVDNECQQRTCNGGKCGISNTPSNTSVAAQVMGDCLTVVCNGQGGTTTIPNDTDVPASTNPCATPGCSGGQPTSTPTSGGTSCGTNKVCDGQGNCSGCVTAADCPGTDTMCQSRTCANNVCGMSYVGYGTAVGPQSAGDCKVNVCNGMGTIITIADDTDVPNDGNVCTVEGCSGGTPTSSPAAAGTACNTSGVCNGAGSCGVCVPGDSRYCCGTKSSVCCYAQAKATSPDAVSDDVSDPDVLCCCGSAQDCDSNGQWGPCY
jgi:hypothetical protein